MTGDVNLTHTAAAIRFSLSRQEGEVRRVTLDEPVALAVADLIDRQSAMEAVIQAAREAVAYLNAGEECEACVILSYDLRAAVAALEDGQ